MEKPLIDRDHIAEASYDMHDAILNGHVFELSGHVVKDLNNRKFYYAPYYLGGNDFSFYLVACETNDPCRIAFELGELSELDFWSRFGFIWKLIPTVSGIYDAERISIFQVEDSLRLDWELPSESPIKITEARFKFSLSENNLSSIQKKKIREFYPLYLQAVAMRKKQWVELKNAA